MTVIELTTKPGTCLIDVTDRVSDLVAESGFTAGLCNLFVPHSTAGVTVNSAIDYETPADIVEVLNRLAPMRTDYVHQFDSPQDAAGHIKSSLVGCSVTIPIDGGRLRLSASQSILFCVFDGPRSRRLYVTVIPAAGP